MDIYHVGTAQGNPSGSTEEAEPRPPSGVSLPLPFASTVGRIFEVVHNVSFQDRLLPLPSQNNHNKEEA